MNPTTGNIYVLSGGDWSVTILSGTAVITTFLMGCYPEAVNVSPVSGYVYVPTLTNELNDIVIILSGTQVITEAAVGKQLSALIRSPDMLMWPTSVATT